MAPPQPGLRSAAWDQLLERLALTRPGRLLLTSCTFGKVYFPNAAIHHKRLEIRQVGNSLVVYSLDRLYIPGLEPRDVQQHREGEFASISEAAAFVDQFLRGFQDAVDDDHAAALAHARETEY